MLVSLNEKVTEKVGVEPITSVAMGDIQNLISNRNIGDAAAAKALEEAQENLRYAQETGYTPELRRNFSLWSLLGVGFGLTNSWFGIAVSLITAVSSGGPMMIVYGIIIIATISLATASTLSELSSAYPSAGGQYYWTVKLAPPKYAPFLSYMCGAFSWAGSVFVSASVSLSIASGLVGMYVLGKNDPDYVISTWSVFVTYELVNIFLVFFNIWEKPLPRLAQLALYVSLLSFFVTMVTVLAKSSGEYNTAEFVFAKFMNNTGWTSSGIAFIVGLINPNWSFACLDSATHMAEELLHPEIDIPKVIFGTVFLGFITAFPYSIAMFFCVKDLDTVASSVTGVPILAIFYQALNSRAGAIVLEVLIILTAIGCNIQSHTWQARLCWSFARDNGIPGSRYWSQVNPRTKQPINAHIMSCVWCAIVGCIYMGSTTAYNALVTAGIVFLYFSYIIPTICLLLKGRDNIKHGPFWLGKIGLFSNYVLIFWTIFTTVFYSFPAVMPATGSTMNYVCVVLFVYTAYAVIYWFARGHRKFRTLEDNQQGIEALTLQLLNQVVQLETILSHQITKPKMV